MNTLDKLLSFAHELLGGSSPFLMNVLGSLAAFLGYLVIRRLLSGFIAKRVEDPLRSYILSKTATYIAGFVTVLVFLKIWLGGIQGMAAYFGILSAGLAIALQDPLTNFAGWIFITTRKPFELGDRIQIGEHRGDVIDIRLFQFTVVEVGNWVDAEQSTGRIIHIPNSWIFRQPQSNYTQGFNFIWDEIPITVTFESNWQKAKEILTDIVNRHSAVESQQASRELKKAVGKYLIYFDRLTPIVWTSVADIGVTLTLRYLCEPRKRRITASQIWEEVLSAFAKANDIDFAYPTTRFYDNAAEGKPGARAKPVEPPKPTGE